MNEIARNLNCQILQENSHVYDLLSELGKNLYFPKGILTQSEEAKQKAHRFNATIGIATEHNQPMFLPLIQETLSNYDPKDLFPYAPPAGKPALRELCREKIIIHNPSVKGKLFSNPIVTNALTHGLSIVADLFVDENDPLILPDKLWGNYNIIFGIRRGSKTITYSFYTCLLYTSDAADEEDSVDLGGRRIIKKKKKKKKKNKKIKKINKKKHKKK